MGTTPRVIKLPPFGPPRGPDLSVVVDMRRTNCEDVTFTVAVSPPFPVRPGLGPYPVRVRVEAAYAPAPKEVELALGPKRGRSRTLTVSFPFAEVTDQAAITPGSWSRRYTITLDPDNQLAERDEANNRVEVVGTCLT